MVDLTYGPSHKLGGKKSTRKTGNEAPKVKLVVALIRAHEEKIILYIHGQKLEHSLWGQTSGGKRVSGSRHGVLNDFPHSLEDGGVTVRKITDHDFCVEFFDGGVGERTGANSKVGFVMDEALTLLDAGEIATVHSDPFVAGFPGDTCHKSV